MLLLCDKQFQAIGGAMPAVPNATDKVFSGRMAIQQKSHPGQLARKSGRPLYAVVWALGKVVNHPSTFLPRWH